MDLSALPVPEEKKAALKAALQRAGEGLSKGDRLLLLEGAMYGVGEIERGVCVPPTEAELAILGSRFAEGRDLVVSLSRL